MRSAFLATLFLFLLCACNAQDNKREVLNTYFPNGKLKSITEVRDGRKNGREELYWGNGNIFMIQYFKDDLLIDSFWQYREKDSGVLFLKGICALRSRVSCYSTSNKIVAENDYKPQMVGDGLVKLYETNSNGKVQSIREYKEGKKDGVDILYYKNGNVSSIKHYKDGSLVPPIINFYTSGNVVYFQAPSK